MKILGTITDAMVWVISLIVISGILWGILIITGCLNVLALVFWAFLMIAYSSFWIFFVPQKEEWMLERFKKFERKVKAGINIKIPFIDRIGPKISMKVQHFELFDGTESIDFTGGGTANLEDVKTDIVVVDSEKAAYEVEDLSGFIKRISQDLITDKLNISTIEQVIEGKQTEEKKKETIRKFLSDKLEDRIEKFANFGIKFVALTLKDINYSKPVQNIRQEVFEARKKEEIAKSAAKISEEKIGGAIKRISKKLIEAGYSEKEAHEEAKETFMEALAIENKRYHRARGDGSASAAVINNIANAIMSAIGKQDKIPVKPEKPEGEEKKKKSEREKDREAGRKFLGT
ncbi:hypothetical protein AMJ49_04085 [Parcubacteria bacterium DG_74_2]|nr:MAG: hypothetical protein AMJ49_04085 [Parcubacteria bacterium DG_74_2]